MEAKRKIWANWRWGVVLGITSAIAIIFLLGIAAFVFNVKDTRFVPKNSLLGHNCFTAYATAAYLASIGTVDLYSPTHYSMASSFSTPIHKSVREIFPVDDFEYPPPFLLLPYALYKIFDGFFAMRAAWFVLNVVCVAAALAIVGWWCGAFRSQPRLLLFPLLLCAPTVLTTIQIGNAHLLILAMSMLAMIAFEQRQPLVGGALLGFAVLAKVWPAVLIAYLLLQRRWRPVLYSVIAMSVFALAGLLLFGPAPYQNFFAFQIPRLSSGTAFDFIVSSPREIVFNISIFGIPHKLYALRLLPSQPELLSPILNWSFTILLGLIVVAVGLRRGEESQGEDKSRIVKAQLWLSLLTLAQLRSPYLPWVYGVISTLWFLLLLAPMVKGWKFAAVGLAWAVLAINLQVTSDVRKAGFDLIYTSIASAILYGSILVGLYLYYRNTRGGFKDLFRRK